MVKIWELFFIQNPSVTELPVITPVVIHHGEKQWCSENNFMDLFSHSEVTSKYIPQFQYELYDLTVTPDESIKGILPLKIHELTGLSLEQIELIRKNGISSTDDETM